MLKNLKTLQLIFAAFGCLLIFVSLFDVQDITKLQITRAARTSAGAAIAGLFFVVLGLVVHFYEDWSGRWVTRRRVSKTATGYEVNLSTARLGVTFGRIEELATADENAAVVLPASEFFDDTCTADDRSALGSFMKKHFSDIPAVHGLIIKEARRGPSQMVAGTNNLPEESFGIGNCVFLDRPLNSKHRIIVAAVSTRRAGIGLHSEVSFIFNTIKRLNEMVSDKRLDRVTLPVLGTGHGGLRNEVALFAMVLAFSEVARSSAGHHLRNVDIVVFGPNGPKSGKIKAATVRRILGVAAAMFDAP
jgi:hypothetical protein